VDGEFRKGPFAGRTIPGAPEHTLHAGLGVSPLARLWIDLEWTLVHDLMRVNDFNNVLGGADNYGVLNLVAQYELPPNDQRPEVSVYLRIDNLTNEEYVTYQSSNSTNLLGAGEAPMPPIGFTGGVSVRF
jgi:outer membrane receptor protein involved in Fe transport